MRNDFVVNEFDEEETRERNDDCGWLAVGKNGNKEFWVLIVVWPAQLQISKRGKSE